MFRNTNQFMENSTTMFMIHPVLIYLFSLVEKYLLFSRKGPSVLRNMSDNKSFEVLPGLDIFSLAKERVAVFKSIRSIDILRRHWCRGTLFSYSYQ